LEVQAALLINAVAQREKKKISSHCLGEYFTIHSFFSYNLLSRYVFVYGLFENSELDWRPVVSNDWNVVNDELERM